MTTPSVKGIDRLAYQFNTSEKFIGFLESFLSQSDEVQVANTELLDERELDTAEGVQLDGIGEIVGIERPIGVTDAIYEWMIRAKILINNTDMSVKKQLELLEFIFPGRTIQYANPTNLSPIYRIIGSLTENELIVFDLIPSTLGVGVEYVGIDDDDEAFAFSTANGKGFSTLATPTSGGYFAILL